MDYISKVLFYSNTREMEMFYIDEQSSTPVSLFTGNIMLVYTNEELINQKYHGATTMILLTDALSATERIIIGEQYRFMIKYFNSESQIQYYLSGNPELLSLKRWLSPYWLMYLGVPKSEFMSYMMRDKIVFNADKYAYEKELKKMDIEEFIGFCVRNKKYIIREPK